jgi:hypothetical protein
MKGIQAVDADHDYILVPHLFPRNKEDKTAYWKHLDWDKSFEDGMNAVGLGIQRVLQVERDLDVLAP